MAEAQFEPTRGDTIDSGRDDHAHGPGPLIPRAIADVELEWHLAHIDRTGAALADGVLDRLSREAREVRYLEHHVLGGAAADQGGDEQRAAVSPNDRLMTGDDVAWYRFLLDQLWQERVGTWADRRRAIVEALEAEVDSLCSELATAAGPDELTGITAVVRTRLETFRSRASDRARNSDLLRTIGELTDKIRMMIRVDLLITSPSGLSDWADLRVRIGCDATVRQAWQACGYNFADIPGRAEGVEAAAPELTGRDARQHLALMLDPSGPVRDRPIPDQVRAALRTPAEGAVMRATVELEVRRASCPGGLLDADLRRRWFLAVHYATSRWKSTRIAAEAAHCIDIEPAASVLQLNQAEPAPQTFDRIRGASLIQLAGAPHPAPASDGWQEAVAAVAFEGARSSRFAIPLDVAIEMATVDTVGVLLRTFFGDDSWNRAARFGTDGLDQLCELTTDRFFRRIHQRLLKDDQLGTGSLRACTPTQWHAVTVWQMRKEAATVAGRFKAKRPLIDETIASPEPSAQIRDIDENVAELLDAGPRTPEILASTMQVWCELQQGRLGIAMDRRLARLEIFRVWLRAQIDFANGSTDAVTRPILRGVRPPLRQALHHFVLTGAHRRAGDDVDEADSHRSDEAITRERLRSSEHLMQAVTTMLIDIGRTSDYGDPR